MRNPESASKIGTARGAPASRWRATPAAMAATFECDAADAGEDTEGATFKRASRTQSSAHLTFPSKASRGRPLDRQCPFPMGKQNGQLAAQSLTVRWGRGRTLH